MKTILIIAGSDSGGGAGIQADIKTAEYFKVFSTTAITAVTAQNSLGVEAVFDLPTDFIQKQLDAITKDFKINAVKIGMLSNKDVIDLTYEFIKDLKIPIVLDPVFISKAGSTLMSDENIAHLKKLFKFTTILTPNLHEAKKLFKTKPNGDFEVIAPCDTVITNIKNGNLSIDKLYYKNGSMKEFKTKFIDSTNLHGTGCSFSTAIAANLALGKNIEEAILLAKNYIYNAIKFAPKLGNGKGPIRHNLNGFMS